MTKEEERDWLCRLRSEIYVYMPKEWLIPMNNALDMAIKSLEQEPCDDAVSRKALLRKMNTKTHEYSNGMGFRKEWVELINSLSPVTPKREQGEWIGHDGNYTCSRCEESPLKGIESMSDCNDMYVEEKPKYCPNCGAEMR